jgi:hypothetical protein
MKKLSLSSRAGALAFAALLPALPLHAATTPWHLTELTGLEFGQAISEEGRVVGSKQPSRPLFTYRPTGKTASPSCWTPCAKTDHHN